MAMPRADDIIGGLVLFGLVFAGDWAVTACLATGDVLRSWLP